MEDYTTYTAKQLQGVNKPLLIDFITSLSTKEASNDSILLKEISQKLDVMNDKLKVQENVLVLC